MKDRIETDTLGAVRVAGDRLFGAQTARAVKNFAISHEHFDVRFLHALALVKKACAIANQELKVLSAKKARLIVRAADDVLSGRLGSHFPLVVWQSGSGTQTNMNMNEVLANRAIQLSGGRVGSKKPIHPNDDVNKGQSSNDVIPTTMHVATVVALTRDLLPALEGLERSLKAKSREFCSIIKVGRTHLMDATPITLGQEFSGYATQIANNIKRLKSQIPFLTQLAIGATAVGTGLNTHPKFARRVTRQLSRMLGMAFIPASNTFEAISAHDALVSLHGALKALAVSLFKIVNDIRWSASGPRSGLSELILPTNEPGSSIMPGKVNPTQCEALLMVCTQVMGNDTAVAIAGAQGNFQLNVFKPLIIHNVLQSIRLLSDASRSFSVHCVKGIRPNKKRIAENLANSLMLVTVLNDHLGYDAAAKIARRAYDRNETLKEAAVALGAMSAKDFEKIVQPRKMIRTKTHV